MLCLCCLLSLSHTSHTRSHASQASETLACVQVISLEASLKRQQNSHEARLLRVIPHVMKGHARDVCTGQNSVDCDVDCEDDSGVD